MKKRLSVLLTVIFICLLSVIPACASDDGVMRVVDVNGNLSSNEAAALEQKLDEVSRQLNMEVVAWIEEFDHMYEDYQYMAYADDAYDAMFNPNGPYESDWGIDGVLYLVCIDGGERPYKYISTCGRLVDALNSDAWNHILDETEDDINAGRYYDGLVRYADLAAQIVADYDNGIIYKEPFSWGIWILIALGMSFIIAECMCAYWKAQLKSVALQAGAADYVRKGSFNLTVQRDIFLYKTVSRTVKQTSSSSGGGSHHSSSGVSHGGGGRR